MNLLAGTIILLNGTSCAGKSSTAKELKNLLGTSSIIMSIDDYMRTNLQQKATQLGCTLGTGKWKSWWEDLQIILQHLPEQEKEDYFNNCLRRFYIDIKNHALDSKQVIVDMVLEDTDDFFEIVENIFIFKVLIYAPLSTILKHLHIRNQAANIHELRVFASALRQYSVLYRAPLSGDEIMLDTLRFADLETYCHYLHHEGYWDAPKIQWLMNRYKACFFTNEDMNLVPKAKISPVLDYDLIVYSGRHTPGQCAQEITMRKTSHL